MSFLEFYFISLLVCFTLSVILCKWFNSLPEGSNLQMDKGSSWVFTFLSLTPFINIATTGNLVFVMILSTIEKIVSKSNFYK